MKERRMYLVDEAATRALGAALAATLKEGGVVLLHGDLGAGKTTLARGFLRGLGYTGAVRSPTYTLLEPYTVAVGTVYHLDLYRLADPEELDYLGLRDLDEPGAIFLVEWPERGRGALPPADLEAHLEHAGDGRRARLEALGPRGEAWLERLEALRPDDRMISNRHQ
jgi:tRNA threonylcarbamoyladenosine biosynthesis protein TsaE